MMKTINPASPPSKLCIVQAIIMRPRNLWILRQVILGSLLVMGVIRLALTSISLRSPYIYYKDLLQEYVLAKSLQAGINPYQPLPQLVHRFIGTVPVALLPHATPHPPPAALFFSPLAWLSYKQAAWLWYGIEILLLISVSYGLAAYAGKSLSIWKTLALALILASWQPFMNDLLYGQLTLLILVLLVSAGLAWQQQRHILAGTLLGVSIALKLFTWPILIWLVFKRQWKAFFSAGVIIILANLVATALIGLPTTLHYYTTVSAQISSYYRTFSFNYSIASLGWRVFTGTGSQVLLAFTAPPLVQALALAPWAALALTTILLALGWFVAARAPSIDGGLALMVSVSILASPVVWTHYLLLLTIPAAWLLPRIRHHAVWIAILLAVLLWVFNDPALEEIAFALAGVTRPAEGQAQISFWAGTITFLPMFCVMGIIGLIVNTLRVAPSKPHQEF